MAVERKNVEIIKLLLSNPNIDISVENEIYYFYSFKVFLMNFMIFINIFLWKKPIELTTNQNIINIFKSKNSIKLNK